MSNRYRGGPVILAALLVLAACGGGSAESEAPTSDPAAPSQEAPMESVQGEPSEEAEEPKVAGGEIDWATVDLTTIDWETIDMSTIDYEAIRDNPTAANLDPETVELIGSRMNRGSATLTIGDQVWEFDTFACVLGHENTRSDTFSFTTNSFQTFDGVETQMQVTIEDPSSTGQVTGDDTVHRITFDDISDFENPSIKWSMNSPNAVTIDGHSVTVEGLFNDDTTPSVAEEIPGTLEATCSDDSRL